MGVVIVGISELVHGWCDNCNAENIATADEINDHEMRNFGGAYGLVGHYEYRPVSEVNCNRDGELLQGGQP